MHTPRRAPAVLLLALAMGAAQAADPSPRDRHAAQCVAALEASADDLARQVKAGREAARRPLLDRLTAGAAFVGDSYLHGDSNEGQARVLVDGLPFAQAAASRKIRVSVALAMALNPKIRVIRIMDGSLLDEDAMKTVYEMAVERDFQVWLETVDSGAPGAIVIEDGHIKEK